MQGNFTIEFRSGHRVRQPETKIGPLGVVRNHRSHDPGFVSPNLSHSGLDVYARCSRRRWQLDEIPVAAWSVCLVQTIPGMPVLAAAPLSPAVSQEERPRYIHAVRNSLLCRLDGE